MKPIHKILITNRGEIACRIIRTANAMSIKTIAVFTDADRHSLYVKMADEAHYLGENNLADTYLNFRKIVQIAIETKADAIHPGYGFLSENEAFANECQMNNICFIGPQSDVIHLMGNKIEARKFVKSLHLPMVESVYGSQNELIEASENMIFPLLMKAAAGGGGKGMRIVRSKAELAQAIETTSREAKNYFGNSEVYIEKYVENPRHIEVQIIGDAFGNVLHLFERECSVQRRYQKIIEESPSPTLTADVRKKMCEAAVKIGKKAAYKSAGTIEFLVDTYLNFYFLEMNTRIQVEHPVTEMVTGVDIVKLQIEIAEGKPLLLQQTEIQQKGHAIECRIYAEKPSNHFFPSPGDIHFYKQPKGENIRIDTAIAGNTSIHSFFDPMISKLIVWAENRETAINLMDTQLQNYIIHGIDTNIGFLHSLMNNTDYQQNKISTSYCDTHYDLLMEQLNTNRCLLPNHFVAAIFVLFEQNKYKLNNLNSTIWNEIGYWRQVPEMEIVTEEQKITLKFLKSDYPDYELIANGNKLKCQIVNFESNCVELRINGLKLLAYISTNAINESFVSVNGYNYKVYNHLRLIPQFNYTSESAASEQNTIHSPMPGKVLKIKALQGSEVEKGDVLLVVESMKMENNIIAPRAAKIVSVNVREGEMVDADKVLMELE